jgi:hypothetical protein
MITMTAISHPANHNQRMWAIKPDVFMTIYEANRQWPGVASYDVHYGSQSFEELTDELFDKQYIEPSISKVQTVSHAVCSEERIPKDTTCTPMEPRVSSERPARKPLTFIDIKVRQ